VSLVVSPSEGGAAMDEHVDIIRNDWLAGEQVLVARVRLDQWGALKVDAPAEPWTENSLPRLIDHETGDSVRPDKEPERYFKLLPRGLDTSYLGASGPHGAGQCPFSTSNIVRMERLDVTTATAPPGEDSGPASP
jgi:hypothetical protein